MKFSLIPGLESFMEDETVDIDVAVDAPEAIEEAEETAEASAEIAETSEEAESTDEQTEMIMSQFAELERKYSYVKQYGVDRTFMRLFNSDNELTRAIRYRFPACESFDTTGNPYSSESVACMEGLGDALKAVWDFIVNLCKKIGAFFGRLFEAIRVRFGNLNDQIGRLREMASERTSWVDNIDEVKATTYQIPELIECITKISDRITKSEHLSVGPLPKMYDIAKLCDTIIKDAENAARRKQVRANIIQNNETLGPKVAKLDEESSNKEAEFIKQWRKAFKEFKKDVNKEIDDVKDNVLINTFPDSDIKELLDVAADLMKATDEIMGQRNLMNTILKNTQTAAENMKRRQDEIDRYQRMYAQELASAVNLMNQCISFRLTIGNRLAGMCTRAASKVLQYRKKP